MKFLSFLNTYFLYFLDTTECHCGNMGYILCPTCLEKIPAPVETPNPYIYSCYTYKNTSIKKTIHALKFESAWHYSSIFSKRLYQKCLFLSKKYEASSVYIISIPLSYKRQKERGYNQSEILMSFIKNVYTDSLEHVSFEDTPVDMSFTENTVGRFENESHLSRLNKLERQKEISNQFFIKDKSFFTNLSDKDLVILLDDVTTTGSTLLELKKILVSTTKATVVGLTVAH